MPEITAEALADAPTAPPVLETPPVAPGIDLSLVARGGYVYLHGAGLTWCCVTVIDVEPAALLVDVCGVRTRVTLDAEAPPRAVAGHLFPLVTITAQVPVTPRRRGR